MITFAPNYDSRTVSTFCKNYRIKYAKMFGSSLSLYNVTHVRCRTYGIFISFSALKNYFIDFLNKFLMYFKSNGLKNLKLTILMVFCLVPPSTHTTLQQ